MVYRSTKTYGHECGLSATFRQWRATHSHCSQLHGYALAFKFVFEAYTLDDRNWVADFGGLDWLKNELKFAFDHKLVVAQDDPLLGMFQKLRDAGGAQLFLMENVGCEAFAEYGFWLAQRALERDANLHPRVRVVSCEVSEHGANSAIYTREEA